MINPERNPFATCFTRPGVIGYRFTSERSAAGVVEQFAAFGWQGEIVGPHGTGKSTLVCTLEPELARRGRTVTKLRLSTGERRLPDLDQSALGPSSVVIIDGYEQLSWWSRVRLARLCRSYGCGLLVTSHESTGLPTLIHTAGDLMTVRLIVRDLMVSHPPLITADDVERSFAMHAGNVRETLFDLYDLYDRRSHNPVPLAADASAGQP